MKLRECLILNIEMTRHLFKASKGYFWINLINVLFNSFAFIFQILFFRYIINTVIYDKTNSKHVVLLFLLYYIISVVISIVNYKIRNQYNEKEKIKINLYYKELIYKESSEKNIKNYNTEEYVNKLHNATYTEGACLYSFVDKVFNLIDAIIAFGFFFSLLCKLHPVFIIVAVLTAIKNIICISKNNRIQHQKYETDLLFKRADKYIYNLFLLKKYSHELRIYSIGDYFIDKYKEVRDIWWNGKKRYEYKEALNDIISESFDLICYVINICFLVYFLMSSKITLGDFSIILTNITTIAGVIQRILMFYPSIYDDAKYTKDIMYIINSEKHKFPLVDCNSNESKVTFEHVFFSYNNEDTVLKDINIDVPLNKKIAIIGENGSGKSTFIKLIIGLYMPDSGTIRYCYKDRNKKNSSQIFSMMLQDYRIFPVSIAENIIPNINHNENYLQDIEKALEFSELKEKIDKLSNGIDTVLTDEFCEEGTNLSGGELQKLVMARTFIKDSPVLILDEPSSNLDPVAENNIIHKLNALSKDRGVILITHNLVYTKNVDLVYVLNKGRIVEYGAPEELKKRKGCYYRMFKEQTKMVGNVKYE